MRTKCLATLGILALALAAGHSAVNPVSVGAAAAEPPMASIGPLTFAPDGVLFAADPQSATIYALELGDHASGGAAGAQSVDAIDRQISCGSTSTSPRPWDVAAASTTSSCSIRTAAR